LTKIKTARDLEHYSIYAIFFDAGCTLVWPDFQAQAEMATQILERPVTQADMMRGDKIARRFANSYVPENGFGTSTVDDEAVPAWYAEFLKILFTGALRCSDDDLEPALNKLIRSFWLRHRDKNWVSVIGPDVIPTLEILKARKIPLGVISNAEGRVESDLADLGLRDYFVSILDSGVEKIAKPDSEIFRRAASRMQLEPEKCLYIGDLPRVDICGAMQAGFQAMHYDPMGVFDDHDLTVPRCRNLLSLAGIFPR